MVKKYYELLDKYPDYKPTITPGFVSDNSKTIPITEPMLSIAKYIDFNKFCKLTKRYKNYTIEEKEDGVAVRLIYDKDGLLTFLHLRGIGTEGTDISHRRFLIDGIPDSINNEYNQDVFITGEVVCSLEDFDKYLIEANKEESKPRSVVSGFLRREETKEDDGLLPLRFIAFHASKAIREDLKEYPKLIEWLIENGFETPNSLTEIPKTKPESIYPIDGIVIKKNDLKEWNDESSMTGYYSYAACFKYPTILYSTKVTGVSWNINTRGYLTAVLNFKPVKIDGSNVSKCQFHYINKFIKKGIGIGSDIEITMSNEIIPKLVFLNSKSNNPFTFPTNCPCCDSKLVEESEGVYYCDNSNCEGKLATSLKRAFSPYGLGIDGLGDKRIELLVETNTITHINQIFSLTINDLLEIGFSKRIARKTIDQINELVSKLSIAKWLFASGIPSLGEVRCLEIESYLKENDCEDIEELMRLLSSQEIMTSLFGIDGLKIVSHVNSNYDDLKELLSNINFNDLNKNITTFIPISITGIGKVERKILKEFLYEKGYWLDNKVTKSSFKLLVGKSPSYGKISLAERYDIPIIHIEDLGLEDIIKQLEKR